MHNDAVRRIMAELKELSRLNAQPQRLFHAIPLESDLFEWHFSVRGPPETAFEGGIYHGRIVLPTDYPLKPPEIILLTPNGRFEVGKRICLSVTAHHQETWQPSWGIRTILTALIGFMPSPAEGLGALDYPDEDRRRLARKSHSFKCEHCGMRPVEQLPPLIGTLGASGGSGGNVLGTASSLSVQPRLLRAGSSSAAGSASAAASSAPTSAGTNELHSKSTANGSSASANAKSNVTNEQETMTRTVANFQQAAASTNDAAASSGSSTRRVRQTSARREEKELLYIAYAIVALMIAIVARRVLKNMSE